MGSNNAQIQHISDLLLDAYDYRVSDLTKSIAMAQEALELSKEISYQEYVAKSYSLLSLFHMILGNHDLSLELAENAIGHYTELGDERGIADAMYTIAGVYYKTNNFHSGLIYLVDCKAIYEKHGDFHNLSRVNKSLGTIYEYFGDEGNAISAYNEAVEFGKKAGDKKLQSNAFNPLSGIYLNSGQIDKAVELIESALAIKKETGDVRGLAFSLYGRGKIHAKLCRYEQAEVDYNESLKIHLEMGENLGAGMVYNKLGALYKDMGLIDQARVSVDLALQLGLRTNSVFVIFTAYHQLYQIAKKDGDILAALGFLETYLREKESVINAQTHKIIEAYHAISEKQSLQQEANSQREKAEIIERKNRELDSFFYRVSHDLKGPITSIIGLDHLVRERIRDKESLEYFDVYKKQVFRINNILDELMKLSRVDHDESKKVILDFDRMLHDCFKSLEFLDNFEHVTLKINVDDKVSFESEWGVINSILQNMVENSIKYADIKKASPEIVFSVFYEKDKLIIRCEDNGLGMDANTRDQIFDMFYKANHNIDGSGMGMYILSRAVERLKGEVLVESELGKFTAFTISLPRY
jgi:signal transduction histidine kinase